MLVNSGTSIDGPSFYNHSSVWSEHLICKDRSSFFSTLWEPIDVTKVTISRAQDTGFCVKWSNIKRLSENILPQEILWLWDTLAPQNSSKPVLNLKWQLLPSWEVKNAEPKRCHLIWSLRHRIYLLRDWVQGLREPTLLMLWPRLRSGSYTL